MTAEGFLCLPHGKNRVYNPNGPSDMILEQTPATIAQSLLANASAVNANNHTAELVEFSLKRGETTATRDGALVATTGKFTGRSPKDKYIVGDATTNDLVWWG